jgi:hypothetical protein
MATREHSNNGRHVLLTNTYLINNINFNPVQLPIKDSIHHLFPHFETRSTHDQIIGAESHQFLSTVHIEPNTCTFSAHTFVRCTSLGKSKAYTTRRIFGQVYTTENICM